MKKHFLLIIAIVASTITFAQVQPSFGIRAGLSSSNMKGDAMNSLNKVLDFSDGMITTSNRTGFFAGPYVTIPLSEKITVEPALYYSQKGFDVKGAFNIKGASILNALVKSQVTSSYIDLPVLLKANLGGFQVFAGPQVSYLAQANFRTKAGLLGFNLLNSKMDITDQFNRWDAGVTGGIGYQFTNGMNITASYDHGLSRIDANKSINSYNRSFKIGIGMNF